MAELKNARHEKFARAIVEGVSGRDAYRGAGYRPKNDATADACASRLLADAKVAERVAELKGAAAEASQIKAEDVLAELAKIGFANMADYVALGVADPAVCLARLSREQAAAISSVTFEETVIGRGRKKRIVPRIKKFTLHDKRAALVDLGNNLGLFKKRVEVSGKDGKPIETREVSEFSDLEVARRIAFLLSTAARVQNKAEKPDG